MEMLLLMMMVMVMTPVLTMIITMRFPLVMMKDGNDAKHDDVNEGKMALAFTMVVPVVMTMLLSSKRGNVVMINVQQTEQA